MDYPIELDARTNKKVKKIFSSIQESLAFTFNLTNLNI